MTTEALDSVLSKLNSDEVIKFFAGMPEKQRKEFAARVLEWWDVCSALNNDDWEFRMYMPGGAMNAIARPLMANQAPKRVQKMLKEYDEAKIKAKSMPPQVVKAEALEIVRLAALATATLTDIKKRDIVADANRTKAILGDRKPSWLPNWIEWVTGEFPRQFWLVIRALEREDGIEVEHNSNYLTGMALSLPGNALPPPPKWVDRKPVREPIDEGSTFVALYGDQQLIPTVWQMLADDQTMRLILHEQPTPTFRRALRNRDIMKEWQLTQIAADRWKAALLKLCQREYIDKMQLLETIMALFVRFNLEHSESGSTLRVSWFTELHDELQPNVEQKFALHQEYLRLLACRNPKVVAWAAGKLIDLVEHSDFPVTTVCESVPSAFLLKGKEHSTQALKLLKAIADKHPAAKRDVAAAAVEAMESEAQDVQKRALSLLEKLKIKDAELCERMQSKLSRIAVVHRAQAASWAGGASEAELLDSESGERSPAPNVVPLRRSKRASSETRAAGTAGGETIARAQQDAATDAAESDLEMACAENVEPASGQRSQLFAELSERVHQLPKDLCHHAGLDQVHAFANQQGNGGDASGGKAGRCDLHDISVSPAELASAPFRGHEIPRLDAAKSLPLLETLDDLIFMVARLLDTPWNGQMNADDLEIVLDGFARLGAERPDDFKQHTESVRVKAIQAAAWTINPIVPAAYAWTTGEQPRARNPMMQRGAPIDETLRDRFVRVGKQIAEGKPVVLFSTPTHQGGLIDPLVLVDRILQANRTNTAGQAARSLFSRVLSAVGLSSSDDDVIDQSLALLRLAPDNRAEARKRLAQAPDSEFVDAFRYALGDDSVTIGKTAELWVAAARARYPFADDQRIEARFPAMGPDTATVARYKLEVNAKAPESWTINVNEYRVFDRTPALPKDSRSEKLLTVRLHKNTRFNDSSVLAWRRTITPMNLDAFFAEVSEFMVRHDGQESLAKPNVVYLETLYDPDIALTDVSRVALCIALASKNKDEHGTAVEAAIACIDDGRLSGIELGALMHHLYTTGHMRPATYQGGIRLPIANTTRWANPSYTLATGNT
jgi:hypothetical protein